MKVDNEKQRGKKYLARERKREEVIGVLGAFAASGRSEEDADN